MFRGFLPGHAHENESIYVAVVSRSLSAANKRLELDVRHICWACKRVTCRSDALAQKFGHLRLQLPALFDGYLDT